MGSQVQDMNMFYARGDGSCLAFFEAPGMPFEFKGLQDFELHIALEVEEKELDGHVIDLTAKAASHVTDMDPGTNGARAKLERRQAREQDLRQQQ